MSKELGKKLNKEEFSKKYLINGCLTTNFVKLDIESGMNEVEQLIINNINFIMSKMDANERYSTPKPQKEMEGSLKGIYLGYMIETLEGMGADDDQIRDVIAELNEIIKSLSPKKALNTYCEFLEYNSTLRN